MTQPQPLGADRHLAHRIDVAESRQGAHLVAQRFAPHGAEVHVEVGGVDAPHQLAGIDGVLLHRRQVEVDPYFQRVDAVQVDAGHAADPLQRAADAAVEQVPRLGEVALGRDAALEHAAAAVRVRLDPDVPDALRQARARPLHRLADLHHLQLGVDVPVELRLDAGLAAVGPAEDPLDVRDGGDLLLDRTHHLAQPLQRVAAGVGDEDVDLRLVDDRHEAERQEGDGDRAEDRQADEQHDGGDRAVER
jgi:hypothetical protein